ncbi:MAG: SIMPL domain-containing protein [bacterium]
MDPKNCCSNSVMQSKAFGVALSVLAIFLAVQAVGGIMNWSKSEIPTNTISVEGTGDAFAIPDVGTFSVSVTKDAKTVAEAQSLMTGVMNPIIDSLKSGGIAEKDIKTESYNINPKYDYRAVDCAPTNYCPSQQILTGYEVTESVFVKVRDISKAGDILNNIGKLGATNVSGLTFSVDNPDIQKKSARGTAIEMAKTKADELAKALGVRLVRIVNFSEGSNSPYYSAMYDKAVSYSAGAPAASPILPAGETKFTSNVTITYEIK